MFFCIMEKSTKEIFKFERKKNEKKMNRFLFLKIKLDDNDGVDLSRQLKECTNENEICQLISSLEGCFAFIYFQVEIRNDYL